MLHSYHSEAFIAAPLAQGLMAEGGWQLALVGFLGLCALMLPAAVFVGAGDRPKDTAVPVEEDRSAHLTFTEALGEAARHRGYVIMAIAFFVCGLQLVFIATHLPAYLHICGQPPELGAQALAVIGGFNAMGCYLLGWLGDRFPKHILLGTVYILRSLLIVVYFTLPASPATTLVFAALMGVLWLGVAPLVNGLVVQIFGLGFVATLSGIAFFSHQAGSFFGAWGGGLLFDAFGNYDLRYGSISVKWYPDPPDNRNQGVFEDGCDEYCNLSETYWWIGPGDISARNKAFIRNQDGHASDSGMW